jgi:hypothetical protein
MVYFALLHCDCGCGWLFSSIHDESTHDEKKKDSNWARSDKMISDSKCMHAPSKQASKQVSRRARKQDRTLTQHEPRQKKPKYIQIKHTTFKLDWREHTGTKAAASTQKWTQNRLGNETEEEKEEGERRWSLAKTTNSSVAAPHCAVREIDRWMRWRPRGRSAWDGGGEGSGFVQELRNSSEFSLRSAAKCGWPSEELERVQHIVIDAIVVMSARRDFGLKELAPARCAARCRLRVFRLRAG